MIFETKHNISTFKNILSYACNSEIKLLNIYLRSTEDCKRYSKDKYKKHVSLEPYEQITEVLK